MKAAVAIACAFLCAVSAAGCISAPAVSPVATATQAALVSAGPSPAPTASDETLPALTVTDPQVAVVPSGGLTNGEQVSVQVTGFGSGAEIHLSECLTAAAATNVGCGLELARQGLLVTGDDGTGVGPFVVWSTAAAGSLTAKQAPCAGGCVLVATLGGGYPFVTTPLDFAPEVVAPPSASEVRAAVALVNRYEAALVRSDFEGAWDLLAPAVQARYMELAAYADERRAFFASVGGRYTVTPNPPGMAPIAEWLAEASLADVDPTHAVLVEVDYPRLAGNNAGWELDVAAPTGAGLRLFPVR
jgi:hypothetical protein